MLRRELAPDSQLSTADIQRLVAHLVRYHIEVVFAEANINRDSIKKLVDSATRSGLVLEIGKEPLYADSLGHKKTDAGTYIGMLQHDARVMQEAWEKNR